MCYKTVSFVPAPPHPDARRPGRVGEDNTMTRNPWNRGIVLLAAFSLLVSPVLAQAPQFPPSLQEQTAASGSSASQDHSAAAQTRTLNLRPDYSKGPRWFPNLIAPYAPTSVPEPVLENSPRLDQLVQGGKLMLSIDDAISLALENNLNIAIERYVPWLDEANLLYAKSGYNGITRFDPILTSAIQQTRYSSPVDNPFLSGSGTLSSGAATGHDTVANFVYSQGFHTGTFVSLTFNNLRESSNFTDYFFNPWEQSSLTLQITQPLLNGFGTLPNARYIIEAKNTVKVGESQFAQQVIATVTQVSLDYWELVFARENVHVEETAVGTDQQLYENNKKQLEIGSMAPSDVVNSESQLASDQLALVQAQTTKMQDETTLLNDISKNPMAVSLSGVEIVPTTPISTPPLEDVSIQDAVKEAFEKRPEIQQDELNLKNAGIEVKVTKNALLPSLNVFGVYQASGLGGDSFQTTGTQTGLAPILSEPVVNPGSTLIGYLASPTGFSSVAVPGGWTGDWNGMINAKYPSIEGGVNLTLPIRNRAAQALNAQALLNQRLLLAQYQQLQNTVFVQVRNAMIALNQDREAAAAAERARDLAQESYDDEVKKFQLGTSTAFTVTQKQTLLTTAEGSALRDRINLIEAEVNFNQAVGRTLDTNHISAADAGASSTPAIPNIPGSPDVAASAADAMNGK